MTELLARPLSWLRHFADRTRQSWDAEPPDYPCAPDDIARLHRVTCADASDALDDHTWRDLLLDRYLEALAPATSLFGRQVLYRRLRAGVDAPGLAAQRARVQALLDDPEQREALHRRLVAMRHAQDYAQAEVAALLFDKQFAPPVAPSWLRWVPLLPVALALSIAAAIVVSPAAWIATFAVMFLLVQIQLAYHERIEAWRGATFALRMLLRACVLLDGSGLPLASATNGCAAAAGRIGRALAPPAQPGFMPEIAEYGKWFFAADFRHCMRTQALVWRERAFLRACWMACAELEADVALARYLAGAPTWCWNDAGTARALMLDEGVHPLLDAARGLSIRLDGKGVFLSGQNGVGKSTFLRTLGLNLAAARGFGFCHARAASLPALPVVASMQNEDTLLGGQSLYVAELARAKEMLAAARGRPVVCLIDEIFRGTNHEEAVAASAAVLDELARHALVVVSSHNLVLGPLLEHRLASWRIVRGADGALRFEPGLLAHTNGVAMLAAHGFGAEIEARAARVAEWLAGQAARLAREGACAEVLGR